MTKSTKIFCLNCWHEVKGQEGSYICPACNFSWIYSSPNEEYVVVYDEIMYRRPTDAFIGWIPDGNLAIFKELPL